jgi:hypothetical protein
MYICAFIIIIITSTGSKTRRHRAEIVAVCHNRFYSQDKTPILMKMYFSISFQFTYCKWQQYGVSTWLNTLLIFFLGFKSFLSHLTSRVFQFVLRDQKLPSSCKNCPSARRVSAKNNGCSDFIYLSKQSITLNCCLKCSLWTLSGTECLTTSTNYTSNNLSHMKNLRLPVQF